MPRANYLLNGIGYEYCCLSNPTYALATYLDHLPEESDAVKGCALFRATFR